MKRKDFISSAIAALASAGNAAKAISAQPVDQKIPPYLRRGDIIGITSPAGSISAEDCAPAIKAMKDRGFSVRTGNSIGKKDFTFGGTDKERLADLQQMLDDDAVRAIMCARGGYGLVRIIDRLNFTKFIRRPKWIIGFSDVTVLHSHIGNNYNIATLHAKMCNSFYEASEEDAVQTAAIDSIFKCLSGEKINYAVEANASNKFGSATAPLIGGNLKTIETLAGTASEIDTKNKILFAEDTGEYLYSVDRMFWNLKRSGKLSNLAGLIIGGFKLKPDDDGEAFGKTVEQIVLEKITEYHYPVCFDFPVGHQKNNVALQCGVVHEFSVDNNGAVLQSK